MELVIPVCIVTAKHGLSLQENIKTPMRSRLSEAKVQNLPRLASATIQLLSRH